MGPESVANRVEGAEDQPGWEDLLSYARSRARSICRYTPVDPDDLAQDALLRLLLQLDRVRDRVAWLTQVMANLFLSELRRRQGRSLENLEPERLPTIGLQGPVEIESRLDLLLRIRRLPPRDRRLLTLYAFGHTHREIGARFDQPVHRVGPSIARALARLRRSLNRLN